MSIRPINETMWDDILRIQSDVYYQIEPEDLHTLRSKWIVSPDCCFVYYKHQTIAAYLLAHAWNSDIPPSLSEPIRFDCHGEILLLHDLAVSDLVKGEGVGRKMVNHLVSLATDRMFREIRLVSIQDSASFWKKFGFVVVENQSLCKSYGKDAVVMQRLLPNNNS